MTNLTHAYTNYSTMFPQTNWTIVKLDDGKGNIEFRPLGVDNITEWKPGIHKGDGTETTRVSINPTGGFDDYTVESVLADAEVEGTVIDQEGLNVLHAIDPRPFT